MCLIALTSLSGRVLEQTHIVEVILYHIDGLVPTFDTVNYDALKEGVLMPVVVESFNPKIQIHGFLKMFRHTWHINQHFRTSRVKI
jgi:hypothetical protein